MAKQNIILGNVAREEPMQFPQLLPRRQTIASALALGFVGRQVRAQPTGEENPWPSLAQQIFKGRPVTDSNAILSIDAPYRAEDAAVVPISLHRLLPDDDTRRIKTITLVIDENPSPVAAAFSLGENSGIRNISTRVRVDSYTKIHAVATMADGSLLATERFVKAAGGCSAPAAKQEAGSVPPVTMRFRQFTPAPGATSREVQLMIWHPNYSGMQMDQVSRLYVPALFIATVHIWQGDDLLLGIESGVSISENPTFRFDYRPNGAAEFRAEVTDSDGKTFKESWSATRA